MVDALARLEQAMASAEGDLVRVGGLVREVSASACRVGGIGPHVRLGDRMGFEQDGISQIGEVVRIDAEGATIKTFGPGSKRASARGCSASAPPRSARTRVGRGG